MNFIQPNFFIFLLVFCCLYRLVGQRARVSIGIMGSFYFYAYFSPLYALILLFSSIVDFLVGAQLARCHCAASKRWWLLSSLTLNLGLLIFFKYASFLWNSTLVPLMGWEEMATSIPPMGISFFTFQTMSYTIDIYRGQLQPTRSFRHFLFYVSFFPQLVAGPIVRAKDFLPQIGSAKLEVEHWQSCLWRFGRGFIKKACLADGLGVLLVDPVYSDPTSAGSVATLLAVVAYGLQLYLDFSGYSDMAIALGRLLGFTFPENFNYPYLAKSFSDFWKRWHISLSSWLRDYLYVSLGGNRCQPSRVQVNLMLTMLLGGLWHGADWSFVVWGALNGAYLMIEHGLAGRCRWLPLYLKSILGHFWVIGAYFFSLIFFRAENCGDAMLVLQGIAALSSSEVGHWWSGLRFFQDGQGLLLLALAASTHILSGIPKLKLGLNGLPLEWRTLIYGSFVFWALHFYPVGRVSPFIYFQF